MNVTRTRAAFLEYGNLVALASAGALTLATGEILPVLFAAGLEAAYLLYVPDSAWYVARLFQRRDTQAANRRTRLWNAVEPLVSREEREQFRELVTRRKAAGSEPEAYQEGPNRERLDETDTLLEQLPLFLRKRAEFRRYLTETAEAMQAETPLCLPESELVEAIQAKCQEQVEWLRSLDTLVSERGGERQSDIATRTDLMHQRSAYVGEVGHLIAELDERIATIQTALSHEENLSVATESAATIGRRLEEIAPRERKMTLLGVS